MNYLQKLAAYIVLFELVLAIKASILKQVTFCSPSLITKTKKPYKLLPSRSISLQFSLFKIDYELELNCLLITILKLIGYVIVKLY